jgi:peptidoglycan hydrolase-like protein with peptidoglycan-binding domain
MRVAYLLVAATAFASAASLVGAEQPKAQMTTGAETLVEQAQKKLAAMDLKPGAVNGIEHKQTRDAVKRFQKSQNLSASGRLDTQTLAALGVHPTTTMARSTPPSEQVSVVTSESSTVASATMLPNDSSSAPPSESSSVPQSEASSAAPSESISPPSESKPESSSEKMAEPASEPPKS